MKADTIKAGGIHYTPPALASFLAAVTVDHLPRARKNLAILGPACGDGALLLAIAEALPRELRRRAKLVGYEMEPSALDSASRRLKLAGVNEVVLNDRDFLVSDGVDSESGNGQLNHFEPRPNNPVERLDVVIANPPYVRTQVLGSVRAQELARRFALRGRVDLYQAFAKAMAAMLKSGGVLGLLISNRFLTVKSGASLRHLQQTEFDLRAIYDLGDTRLFSAAVLPVVVIGNKPSGTDGGRCVFDRVYEARPPESAGPQNHRFRSVLDAVRQRDVVGRIRTPAGTFRIERGFLSVTNHAEVWSLSTAKYDDWLDTVRARHAHVFDDVARVRFGIKTTADEVFIRDEWDDLPESRRPESELVKPLITHRDACRWTNPAPGHRKSVLYPYCGGCAKRVPIRLDKYPGARK
jgi:adenine-specific DNA-methyltransferase